MKARPLIAARLVAPSTLALVILVVIGCGEPDWRMEPVTPFSPGEVVGPGAEIDPRVELLAPVAEGGIRVKAGEKLPVRVRLTFQAGGRTPIFLTAYFRVDKADAGSFALAPIERRDKSFTLGSTVTTPPRPGKYRLEIEAVYFDFEATAKLPADQPPKDRRVVTKVADVDVRR
ncbi:MAG: hypothetical protein BGO49_18515 [Planctomycetales bacterium 71-10]|nr:MAG: hypothetical protein BGO49_18515 [Planctomycetales bacterium 71-10]